MIRKWKTWTTNYISPSSDTYAFNSVDYQNTVLSIIREFSKNKVMRSYLGEEFFNAYLKIKNNEWNEYSRNLSDWERLNTLDC